jgi:hypothetical protein
MNITVESLFTSKCLNQPLTVWAAADNSYNATLSLADTGASLGTMSGADWSVPNNRTISTVGLLCGNKRLIQDRNLSLKFRQLIMSKAIAQLALEILQL